MYSSNSQLCSVSGLWTWAAKTLFLATALVYLSDHGVNMSPMNGEGMVPEFMAGLNSVPRMGRRSLSPFMRSALGGGAGSSSPNGGGFRFINSRPRRRAGPYNPFGGGYPSFRFAGGPDFYQGALRSKRVQEAVPNDVANGLRSAKRVLPPVHVGSSMFPSVRQQQNQYWQGLLNEAARESLLQRLSGIKEVEGKKPAVATSEEGNIENVSDYSRSPLARFLSRYQGSSRQ